MPLYQINFESLYFNHFCNESFSDTEDERDPGENFFNEVNIGSFICYYLLPNEIESFLSEKENSKNSSAIYVNIRSLPNNFDNILDIVRDSNCSFNVLRETKTWCKDSTLKDNTFLSLPNFDIILKERQTNKRRGGALIYIQKTYDLHNVLRVSDKDKKILAIEISRENDNSPKLLLIYFRKEN